MNRRRRELYTVAADLGLSNVAIVVTGGNHLRITGEWRGETVRVTCAMSPSCHHALDNTRADLKRAMRAIAM